MLEVIIAIGSNIGNREENIQKALKMLSPHIAITAVSSNYYSKALVPDGAPEEWDMDYLNIVLVGDTQLTPVCLLDLCKQVEQNLGRGTDNLRWSPRIIDVDIILYNNQTFNLPQLQIPHPEYKNRDFVKKPMDEIRNKCKYLVF